jgi:hypothetical protein
MTTVLIAGDEGLRTFDGGGTPGPVHLQGRAVTTFVGDRDDLWAIVDRREVWHGVGRTDWTHRATLEGHEATSIAFTDELTVGTTEARLFQLDGDALHPVEAFDRVEGRDAWYTPWGGPPDTRSFSEWGHDVYVNVHVGGIPRTDDGGRTWTPTIDVDADVHQVATARGLVLAACAGGLASSADRGATWTWRTDGLEAPYSRAVVVCGDVLLLSASNGPGGSRSAVYRGSVYGDGPFDRCGGGLPEAFDDNVDTYCLDALPDDGSFAVFGTADGRVFASEDQGRTWDELASGLPAVQRVLVVP